MVECGRITKGQTCWFPLQDKHLLLSSTEGSGGQALPFSWSQLAGPYIHAHTEISLLCSFSAVGWKQMIHPGPPMKQRSISDGQSHSPCLFLGCWLDQNSLCSDPVQQAVEAKVQTQAHLTA